MSRSDVWMHVTVPGKLMVAITSPEKTDSKHYVVHARSDDEALACFELHMGFPAEYWVSYRSRDEIDRWLGVGGAKVDEQFEA